MKLFRLSIIERRGCVYEEMYVQKIILAENEENARKLAKFYDDNSSSIWGVSTEVICESINMDTVHEGFLGGVFIHCQ
jgi:hypothetical protein